MSPLKLFSSLMASACLAWVVPAASLAQSLEPRAESPLLAQVETSDTLMDLETQPDAPEDLVIEDLTDEQAAQIVAIFDTYQPQIDAATADYLEALIVLNDLLVPETSDLALTNARNDVVATEQVIDDLVFRRNLAIRSVLTLEQRQIMNDYVRAWLGLGPADTVAVFPKTLIGIDAKTALGDLQADGWSVVVRTPGYIGLNRGTEELNLGVDRYGEIVDAEL